MCAPYSCGPQALSGLRETGGEAMTDPKPTYDDLVKLLRLAPPRQAIDDRRYWEWRSQVEDALARVEE